MINYFGIIGASESDIKTLIKKVKDKKDVRLDRMEPEMLSRIPHIDVPNVSFPFLVKDVIHAAYFNSFYFLNGSGFFQAKKNPADLLLRHKNLYLQGVGETQFM